MNVNTSSMRVGRLELAYILRASDEKTYHRMLMTYHWGLSHGNRGQWYDDVYDFWQLAVRDRGDFLKVAREFALEYLAENNMA